LELLPACCWSATINSGATRLAEKGKQDREICREGVLLYDLWVEQGALKNYVAAILVAIHREIDKVGNCSYRKFGRG
jgi:hypothetical protein